VLHPPPDKEYYPSHVLQTKAGRAATPLRWVGGINVTHNGATKNHQRRNFATKYDALLFISEVYHNKG